MHTVFGYYSGTETTWFWWHLDTHCVAVLRWHRDTEQHGTLLLTGAGDLTALIGIDVARHERPITAPRAV